MKNQLKGSLLLLLGSLIWGCAFVVQEEAASIGTFTLNGIRFMIGAIIILPLLALPDNERPIKRHSLSAASSAVYFLRLPRTCSSSVSFSIPMCSRAIRARQAL